MIARPDVDARPAPFLAALDELRDVPWRPELTIEDIPAPQRIAPHAAAISADVSLGGEEVGAGRLVLLHDPAGNAAWDGTFRLVSFARAEVDPEMVTDPLLTHVGWSWLIDALDARHADYLAPSGTVTAVSSTSFGSMEADPSRAEVEIRASWTPLLDEGRGLTAHLFAWSDLLCTTAGLPPLPEGVVLMRAPGPRRA